jgi:enoyl-CoA hydratase
MALCCDFLIASDQAVFIDSHAKLGIHPGWGMTKRLQESVGRRRAKQMSFTGRPVPADKACEWGLVNEVVPSEMLLPRARQIAGHICDADPLILKKIKILIDAGDELNGVDALDLERKNFISFLNNPEEKGQSAFTS